jgi:hypothetical protein
MTSFFGDPNDAGRTEWRGRPLFRPLSKSITEIDERAVSNRFFTVSAFAPSDRGSMTRSQATFRLWFVLVIDDVGDGLGAKVPWSKLQGHSEPTYVMETSPGNFQVGYVLSEPVEDRATADAALDAMIYQGLGLESDPGMISVTRNVRLQGYNGKAKYRADDMGLGFTLPLSEAPRVRLVHWRPEVCYALDEIVDGFGLDLEKARVGAGAGAGNMGRPGMAVEDDPWVEVWHRAGFVKGGVVDKGHGGSWLEVTCPQVAEHTGGVDDGSAYAIGGGMRCHHGHCETLNWPQVRDMFLRGEHGEDARRAAIDAYAVELLGGGGDGGREGLVALENEIERLKDEPLERPKMVIADRGDGGGSGDGGGGLAGAGGEGGVAGIVVDVPQAFSFETLLKRASEFKHPTGDSAAIAEAHREIQAFLRDVAMSGFGPGRLTKSEDKAVIDELADKLGDGFGSRQLASDLKAAREKIQNELERAQREQHRAELLAETEALAAAGEVGAWKPRAVVQDTDLFKDNSGDPDNPTYLLTANNTKVILDAMRVSVWFDLMVKTERFDNIPEGTSAMEVLNHIHDNCMLNELNKGKVSLGQVREKVRAIGARNARHPFEEYLKQLPAWDGDDRMPKLFNAIKVPSGDDAEIKRRNLILERWLFSIIGAALFLYKGVPGAQPRLVLALSGGQHIGKTTWAAKLFRGIFPGSDQCYMGGSRFGTDKDSIEKLIKHLVCELGELETSTGKTGELKQFLSADVDEYRRPYDAEVSTFYRRSVYLGTVNPDGNGFLPDQTGNSRFGVVNVSKVDLNAIDDLLEGEGVHQLWSEIQTKCLEAWRECHAYVGKVVPGKPYAPWLLTAEEIELIGVGNEAHREVPEIEELLDDVFDWDDEFWRKALDDDDHLLALRFNPMTRAQVVGHLRSYTTGAPRGLSLMLRKRIGCGTPVPTEVKALSGIVHKGRLWPMPPFTANTQRATAEEIAAAVTPPEDSPGSVKPN